MDTCAGVDAGAARAARIEGEATPATRRRDHTQRDRRRTTVIGSLPIQGHRELRALRARGLDVSRAGDVGESRLEGRCCGGDREAGQAGGEESEGGDQGGEGGAHDSNGNGSSPLTWGNEPTDPGWSPPRAPTVRAQRCGVLARG